MTGWSQVITKAKVLIDDVRWDRELAVDPARFYRAKSDYVLLALPLLNRPPNLQAAIKNGMAIPQYNSYSYPLSEDISGNLTIETGMTGYEIASVVIRGTDGISETPVADFAYDAESGNVKAEITASAGQSVEIDFYTDGQFADLSDTILRLFALAVAVVWDERFDNNWLNMQQKIHDSSFSTANEGNYAEKISQRRERNRAAFTEELKQYEQNVAYLSRVPQGRWFTKLKG
jgi:hypothetical protein